MEIMCPWNNDYTRAYTHSKYLQFWEPCTEYTKSTLLRHPAACLPSYCTEIKQHPVLVIGDRISHIYLVS